MRQTERLLSMIGSVGTRLILAVAAVVVAGIGIEELGDRYAFFTSVIAVSLWTDKLGSNWLASWVMRFGWSKPAGLGMMTASPRAIGLQLGSVLCAAAICGQLWGGPFNERLLVGAACGFFALATSQVALRGAHLVSEVKQFRVALTLGTRNLIPMILIIAVAARDGSASTTAAMFLLSGLVLVALSPQGLAPQRKWDHTSKEILKYGAPAAAWGALAVLHDGLDRVVLLWGVGPVDASEYAAIYDTTYKPIVLVIGALASFQAALEFKAARAESIEAGIRVTTNSMRQIVGLGVVLIAGLVGTREIQAGILPGFERRDLTAELILASASVIWGIGGVIYRRCLIRNQPGIAIVPLALGQLVAFIVLVGSMQVAPVRGAALATLLSSVLTSLYLLQRLRTSEPVEVPVQAN